MEVKKLKAGDEVMWSHIWGSSPWKKARAHMIAKCAEYVDEVPWVEMTDRSVVLYLYNGLWAYGNQVKPLWDNSWTKTENAIDAQRLVQ
jgi:hypothetical protein